MMDIEDTNTSNPPTLRCNDQLYQFVFTRKKYDRTPYDEHLKKCEQYLENESNVDFCLSKRGHGKCTCLHILRQAPMRQPVARYLVDMLRKPDMKDVKKSTIIGWYEQAVANRTESESSGRLLFPLPFNNSDSDIRGIIDTLKDAKICQRGLCKVMGVTKYFMNSIRKAASSATLVALPSHGLTGKPSNHSLDPELQSALEDHLATLCKSAIPEHEMGLQTNLVYLPESDEYRSYQSCYNIFIEGRESCSRGLGGNDGDEPMLVENHQKQKVCYNTYMNAWRANYPHLKLMKQKGKAEKEGDGFGDSALKGGENITGDLGGEEGDGINAAADGSGGGGGAMIDDADVSVEYNDFGGGDGGVREVSDSSTARQEGRAGVDTPADDGLRGRGSGDDGGANIDTGEADKDHLGGGDDLDGDLDLDGDIGCDIDGEGGGEGGGGGGGGGGSTCGLGGTVRGILDARTDDCLRQVGSGGSGGATIGTVDADNDQRACEEVIETVIGGSEERKEEVMADEDRCTLGGSNTFMMMKPKNALTPKRRQKLIGELKKLKHMDIWDGLIGGKYGDKDNRWHAAKLSSFPELLGHVEECMKDYVAIVQKRYPDLKYVQYNVLKTAPRAKSQYVGCGETLHADFLDKVHERPPHQRPVSVIVALDPFEFMYLPNRNGPRSSLATTTVEAGHMIAFTSDCLHAGGENKHNKTVYRLFAYMVSKKADFPKNHVRPFLWTSDDPTATISIEVPMDNNEDDSNDPNATKTSKRRRKS